MIWGIMKGVRGEEGFFKYDIWVEIEWWEGSNYVIIWRNGFLGGGNKSVKFSK